MKKAIVLTVLGIILLATAAAAAGGDAVLGVWLNQEKDAKIEIYRCAEQYCGKVVWLKEPVYPPGSQDGVPGTPKVDHHNPDHALRSRPIIGLTIVRGMTYAGDNTWKHGTIYDPKSGKTYSAKMTLVSPAELHLRGYIGISLIGRTAIWTR